MQTDKNMTGPGTASAPSGRPGLTDNVRETARREMDDARDHLHEAAGRARSGAREARSSVSRLVMDEVDRRKEDLCAGIHGLAESMRKAADEAERREDTPTPPHMIHQAINTLDDMADRMRHRSADDMARSVARFGRENPALFVGGALFAGLALGRFLVSSSSDRHRRGNRDNEDRMGLRDEDRWGGSAAGGTSPSRGPSDPMGTDPMGSRSDPTGSGVGGTRVGGAGVAGAGLGGTGSAGASGAGSSGSAASGQGGTPGMASFGSGAAASGSGPAGSDRTNKGDAHHHEGSPSAPAGSPIVGETAKPLGSGAKDGVTDKEGRDGSA
ncbi:hypothetical protein LV780_08340 [Cereibacter azotoformans]|uniref:DUF3618 domain-containing protein n=1 Tax=Cereibacter azotoformans TaxID=43057 RepID=A0A2T5KBA8_9RHOB|nr:hypothetical protein [Cereibacter azotoformans]AXQ93806.1 hypothetical protein D0Z66_08380 [Cereibacter sphaeroides]MBO4168392.1 hypothetical protein [Cereibacter azotoformans]PTR19707.1 hypothetical protein C8J28_104192 [Cereibacter azotoformans]UIJ29320.1 hypothetical protein LV780_08340 [Cereibacter azotoformans]